jgi:alkylated DNA repair protein alkB family protein 1
VSDAREARASWPDAPRLGHACIFLLGTSSRADPPIPLILRSGDVLVMAGRGRQAYHGVPRIMEGTLPSHFARIDMLGDEAEPAEEENEEAVIDRAVREWMQTARINVNVRQVFPPGFVRPEGGEA